MARQGKRSELSIKHLRDGSPVPLGANIRTGLKKRLQQIAVSEDRTLDYVVDQMLRRAVRRTATVGRGGSD